MSLGYLNKFNVYFVDDEFLLELGLVVDILLAHA